MRLVNHVYSPKQEPGMQKFVMKVLVFKTLFDSCTLCKTIISNKQNPEAAKILLLQGEIYEIIT